jgi:hypothetical protein
MMTGITRRILILAACVTTALAGICHARAQSASPAGGENGSGNISPRGAQAQTAITRPASRPMGPEIGSGTENQSAWGAGMKGHGPNTAGMWNAGARSFGSTVQPGGIWRSSTSGPSGRPENAATAGGMAHRPRGLISTGETAPLQPKTGFRESTTVFPHWSSASNPSTLSHMGPSTTSHIPSRRPSGASSQTASRNRYGAAFGTGNTPGSHRASARSHGSRRSTGSRMSSTGMLQDEDNASRNAGDLGGGLLGTSSARDLQSGSSMLGHSGSRVDDSRKGARHPDRDRQVH